jgi:hypothetical protein
MQFGCGIRFTIYKKLSPLPPPVSAMTEVRDFVATLPRAGKSSKEIKPLVDAACGDKPLSISQINRIIKAVKDGKSTSDQRHSNAKKTKRTGNVVAAVAAAIETDQRLTIRELAVMLDLTFATVQSTLTVDLGLVKKSARWIPKLLSSDQKEERVKCSEDFLQLLRQRSLAVLDNIVTMDESTVSFDTTKTKRSPGSGSRRGNQVQLRPESMLQGQSKKSLSSLTPRRNLYKLRSQGRNL